MSAAFTARASIAAGWIAAAMGASIPVSVASDNALLGLLLGLWALAGGPRRSWEALRASRAAQLALGLLALLGLGALWAEVPAGERLATLWKYRELALIVILLPLFADPRVRRQGLVALCAAVIVSVLISYLLHFGLAPGGGVFKGGPADPYVFKLRITHNFLAVFGAFVLAAAALRARPPWQRAVLSLLALACVLNVVLLVQGRTGYVVLAGLVTYAFAARLGWKGVIAGAGLVGALGLAAFYGSNAFHDRVVQTWHEAEAARDDPAAPTSVGLRLQFYRTSAEIVRDHPFLGVGTGGFAEAYAERVRGTAMEPTRNPHNEYLLLASHVGLGGPLLFVLLLGALWRACGRLPKRSLEREVGQAMVIAMALGCVFNAFLLDHTEGLVFAWVSALALGARLDRAATSAESQPSEELRHRASGAR
ncbi:MAG: O-antigen ligase family protein [Burkholderiales bacterium]|nr:O-antigen ligase family protein [Burkholderiales bacterium]